MVTMNTPAAGDTNWTAAITANWTAIQNEILDKSIVTAKGDLLTASAAATPVRLGVGTDGQVLMADSTQTSGLRWGGGPPVTNPAVRVLGAFRTDRSAVRSMGRALDLDNGRGFAYGKAMQSGLGWFGTLSNCGLTTAWSGTSIVTAPADSSLGFAIQVNSFTSNLAQVTLFDGSASIPFVQAQYKPFLRFRMK